MRVVMKIGSWQNIKKATWFVSLCNVRINRQKIVIKIGNFLCCVVVAKKPVIIF